MSQVVVVVVVVNVDAVIVVVIIVVAFAPRAPRALALCSSLILPLRTRASSSRALSLRDLLFLVSSNAFVAVRDRLLLGDRALAPLPRGALPLESTPIFSVVPSSGCH